MSPNIFLYLFNSIKIYIEISESSDFEPPVKPRRSLLFETPKGKPSLEKDDFSNSPLTLGGSDVLNTSYKKRGREKGSQSDSDLEYDDEDLNCTGKSVITMTQFTYA